MKNLVPDEALDKHVAILGMTGAGKSSVIRSAIVEPDLEADRRVLVITPKDDWWGLRLSKSGKSKGFDIPIFGGWHGDYPLNVKDAALLAEAYATMKGSAIFVTSRLSVQDRARWFSAFAETILGKNKGWARLVVDEAHVFMPKQGAKGGGALPAALHAGNELVSQGRSIGLRIVLASQRSAKLHNDALTQCSCLMAMLLMAPHDRDAVKDWIEDQADPVKGREIVSSLATLSEGQAWVWAPRAKMLQKIQFPMPKTFDSSAAPDDGDGEGPRLAPIDLAALKGKLATVEAEKKANDPKELRAEVSRLAVELAAARRSAVEMPRADPRSEREAERRGFAAGKSAAEKAARRSAAAAMATAFSECKTEIDGVLAAKFAAARKAAAEIAAIIEAPPPLQAKAQPVDRRRGDETSAPTAARSNGGLPSAAAKMLAVMDTNPPVRRSWTQVATLAGLRARGGHFNTGRKALIDGGFVVVDGSVVMIAAPSSGAVAPVDAPDAVVEMWARNLSGAAPKILRHLSSVGGSATTEEIADALGMKPTGGHWNTSWKELRDNDIVSMSGNVATLTELFSR